MSGLEVLGAVASAIALAQLAAQVAQSVCDYVGAVKKAPQEDLVEEVKSLCAVLKDLQEYTDRNPASKTLKTLNAKDGPIPKCVIQLEVLKKLKLTKTKGVFRTLNFRRLKWPLEKADTMQIILCIERQKSLFILAINTDHIILSETIKKDTEGIKVSADELSTRWKDEQDIQRKKKRGEVLSWFCSETTDTNHREISNERQKYTGRWLVESLELKKLVDGRCDSHILWGYGIRKTFLRYANVYSSYAGCLGPVREHLGNSVW